jgi:hypothetical protein
MVRKVGLKNILLYFKNIRIVGCLMLDVRCLTSSLPHLAHISNCNTGISFHSVVQNIFILEINNFQIIENQQVKCFEKFNFKIDIDLPIIGKV